MHLLHNFTVTIITICDSTEK